jgi:hypothetical protein
MRAGTILALVAALAAACGDASDPARSGGKERPASSVDDDEGALAAEVPTVDAAGIERVGGVWLLPVDASFTADLEAPVARALAAEIDAARLGDDVLYARLGPENLRVKRTLERILEHGRELSATSRGKLERYLLGFYVHHGAVPRAAGARTNAAGLLRPEFIPGELASAAELAVQGGAALDIPKGPGLLAADRVQEIEALMKAIRPAIFGRSPAGRRSGAADAGPDEATAEPAREGPSPEELAAFAAVVERLRADGLSRPGAELGDAQIAAPAPGTIFLLGFEPAAQGGEIRGLVGAPDPAAQAILDAVAARAAALDKIVRRQGGAKSVTEAAARGRVTRAVRDLYASGALGPLVGRGELWHLVDGPVVEVDAGGRGEAWLLTGAAAAFDAAFGRTLVEAFSRDPATASLRISFRSRSRLALLALREAAGRGTDGTETRTKEWSAAHLGAKAPVLAAMRADLAALHLAFDPAAQETGVVEGEEGARALYEDYVGWAFESYGFGAPPAGLEAAAEARWAITRYLVDQGAVEVAEAEGGGLRYGVRDFGAARAAVARLLAEVRRIRFVGDAVAAAALLDTRSGSEARWRRDVEARFRALDRPRAVGFSYPRLGAADGAKGYVSARLAASKPGPKAP